MKQNEIEIFQRYFSDQTSEGENEVLETLLQKGEDNNELKQILEKEWLELSKVPHEQNSTVERIHGYILQNIIEDLKKNQNTFFRRVTSFYAKIAAILFIPILLASLAGFYFLSHNKTAYSFANDIQVEQEIFTNTVMAPFGSRVSFTLPDNTTGMLNSGSKLTYSTPFNGNRSISLEGEAWFEVEHSPNNPFLITAGNSTVKVLGTSFNINAYPIEDYIEVVLSEGEVEFKGSLSDSTSTIIQPSEILTYKNGNISKTITDPAKYSSWKDGKLMFRGDPMAEVARRIERWYNVRVIIANKELEHYSFRGTFIDDSLEEVLNLLVMTSPMNYKRSPRKILPDGTYDKEIITIYSRKTNS